MSETPKAEPVVEEARSKDSSVDVEPHHASADPEAARQYTDIALTGLFNAHAVLIASERQAIWTRYTAMMMGNAILISFLSQQIENAVVATVVGCALGVMLCIAWGVMFHHGYRLFRVQVLAAMRFRWALGIPNPITELWAEIYSPGAGAEAGVVSKSAGGRWDLIKISAYVVVGMFVVAYLGLVTFALVPL